MSNASEFNQLVATVAIDAGRATKPIRQDGPSGRFYLVDGEAYPSVTHILQCVGKPALIAWAANTERTLVSEAAADLYEDLARIPQAMPRSAYLTTLQARIGKVKAHQRELAKASEIGTQAHALIEWNLRRSLGQEAGPEPRVTDNAQWAFMAWEDWSRSVHLKPVYIEQVVYSRMHKYAGTMDLLAEVDGVLTVIDFKTSKSVYPEAFLQTTAYRMALAEMGHAQVDSGCIVRLPKVQTDPAFEVVTVPAFDELWPIFLAVRTLWAWSFANDAAYRERQAKKGA